MINLSVRLAEAGAIHPVTSRTAGSSRVGTQSFESQLSEAGSPSLRELGVEPSPVHVTVNGLPSQVGVTRQNSATPASPTPAPVAAWQTGATPVSPDDAYWESQPAAVQQLRNMPDETQRAALAMQLAHEGYTIDYPIMVEGWDPQIATQIRQAAGYTWVPSALQSPVPVAPGLSFPGLPAYNPNDPPAGSILV